MMAIALIALVVMLGYVATIGSFSAVFYKDVKCDFDAIMICTAIGCTLWFGVFFSSILKVSSTEVTPFVMIVGSLPTLTLLFFAIYGTVLMSGSKTCKATAKAGPQTFLLGDLYLATDNMVVTAYFVFFFPFLMACSQLVGAKLGSSMSNGAGYGSGV